MFRLIVGLVVAMVGWSAVGQPANRVVGYYAGWSAGRYPVAKIPGEELTHLNYAFAVIRDGECTVKNLEAARGHFREFGELKKRFGHLKVLVSVGGWTDSGPFSDMALTQASREKFAGSCAAFAREHGLDGIDIDWEYPGGGGAEKDKGRPEDTRNFTLLLAELREQLDALGKETGKAYLLTVAASASASHYRKMELDQIHRYLDFINVMTYDFAGEWSQRTSFNAPLYPAVEAGASADASMRGYLDGGIPKEKLVLGVPFYGKAWGGVKNAGDGFNQPHGGRAPRVQGGYSYRGIVANHLGKMKRFWHEQARVPWLYDEGSGVMISYDDAESIGWKARYVKEKGLGGVMIWELSEDDEEGTLLKAVNEGLK